MAHLCGKLYTGFTDCSTLSALPGYMYDTVTNIHISSCVNHNIIAHDHVCSASDYHRSWLPADIGYMYMTLYIASLWRVPTQCILWNSSRKHFVA